VFGSGIALLTVLMLILCLACRRWKARREITAFERTTSALAFGKTSSLRILVEDCPPVAILNVTLCTPTDYEAHPELDL